jgi:hypothetical protein
MFEVPEFFHDDLSPESNPDYGEAMQHSHRNISHASQ